MVRVYISIDNSEGWRNHREFLHDVNGYWAALAQFGLKHVYSVSVDLPFNIWRTVVLHSFLINIMLYRYVTCRSHSTISFQTSSALAIFSSVPVCGVDVPENAY